MRAIQCLFVLCATTTMMLAAEPPTQPKMQPQTQPAVMLVPGHYIFDDKDAKELQTAFYELWVPPTLTAGDRIRGVFLISEHEGGKHCYDHAGWRDLAGEQKLVLLRYNYFGAATRRPMDANTLASLQRALDYFAKQIGHPELRFSCMIPTGLSAGGGQTVRFANLWPDRTIGLMPIHGGGVPSAETAYSVPGLMLVGAADRDGATAPAMQARAKGALWSPVVQLNTQHATPGSQDLPIAWAKAVIALRVPKDIPTDKPLTLNKIEESSGWLGVMKLEKEGTNTKVLSADVYAFDKAPVDKSQAYWLPNESVAKMWVEYQLKGGSPATPQRVSVRANRNGSEPAGVLTFWVTRAGDTNPDLKVSYAVSGGTAKAGDDYVAPAGTLELKYRHPQGPIEIPIKDDKDKEDFETVTIKLLPGEGYVVDPQEATAVIIDDESGLGPINSPPVARYKVSTLTPKVGEVVEFDGSESFDPDKDKIITYDWQYGDGSTGAGVKVSRAYTRAGVFQVNYTVVDVHGNRHTTSFDITIRPADSAPASQPAK